MSVTSRRKTAGILLLVLGGLGTGFGLLFGVAFPILGALVLVTGFTPDGEDPTGVGVGLILAGLLTGAMYAGPGIASLASGLGVRRERSWARWAGIASAALCHWIIPPVGLGLAVIVIVLLAMQDDAPEPVVDRQGNTS